jgi:hypothetical protein
MPDPNMQMAAGMMASSTACDAVPTKAQQGSDHIGGHQLEGFE